MPWTTEQKIAIALRLPWTVRPETTPEGDRLLRVAELPAAVGCGHTDEDLERDFWESLEATLAAYFEFGDALPHPDAWPGPFPWELPVPSVQAVRVADGQPREMQAPPPVALEPPLQREELATAA